MKQKLHLSREIYEELSAKQQAELAEKYEVTLAKRAYSNGVA